MPGALCILGCCSTLMNSCKNEGTTGFPRGSGGSGDKYSEPFCYYMRAKPRVRWARGDPGWSLENLSPLSLFSLHPSSPLGNLTPSWTSVPAPLLNSRPMVQLPIRSLNATHSQLYITPHTCSHPAFHMSATGTTTYLLSVLDATLQAFPSLVAA